MLFKSLLALAALTSPAFSNPTPEHGQARDAPFVLTQEYAQGLFDNLKNRDTWPNFLNVLDDSLEWTITNPDPDFASNTISGTWTPKQAFLDVLGVVATYVEPERALTLALTHPVVVTGNVAMAELRARGADGVSEVKGKNGVRFDNRYVWVVEFNPATGTIVTGRAYYDTVQVNSLMGTTPVIPMIPS